MYTGQYKPWRTGGGSTAGDRDVKDSNVVRQMKSCCSREIKLSVCLSVSQSRAVSIEIYI